MKKNFLVKVAILIALLYVCTGCSDGRAYTSDYIDGTHWEVTLPETGYTRFQFGNGDVAIVMQLENGDKGVVLGTLITSNKILVTEYSRSTFDGEFIGYTANNHFLIFRNGNGQYTAAKFLKGMQLIQNYSGINDPNDPVVYPVESWVV